MNNDNYYMEEAYKEALLAFDKGEVPVGAVIVDCLNGEIIARAHNSSQFGFDATAHAEVNAIRSACKKLEQSRLENCDLYVTLEPCPMCASAIALARIRRLYFGAYDVKGGGVEHNARIFEQASCNHKPEIYGGICENKCGQILKTFFSNCR